MTKHVMVDLETLGTVPGCTILSIGAVEFDPTGKALAPTPPFYTTITRQSCKVFGLEENADTLRWWNTQDAAAKTIFEEVATTGVDLTIALEGFNNFLRLQGDDVRVWGNGSDFDNAILSVAYEKTGITPYWKFWNNRCYRTLKSLAPHIKLNRVGTYHNALDDARSQSIHAIAVFEWAGFHIPAFFDGL